MFQFKTVLLTTDLSDNAFAAAPFAMELARQSDGTVFVLHVFEDSSYASDMAGGELMGFDPQAVESNAMVEREAKLKSWIERLPPHENVRVIPILVKGHAVERILSIVKQKHADLIVIATHGRTGLAHLLSGSVAEKIVRLSECPVLTVRPKTHTTPATH